MHDSSTAMHHRAATPALFAPLNGRAVPWQWTSHHINWRSKDPKRPNSKNTAIQQPLSYLHCQLRSEGAQRPGSGPANHSKRQVKDARYTNQHIHSKHIVLFLPALSAALSGRAVPWERPSPLPPVPDSGAKPKSLSASPGVAATRPTRRCWPCSNKNKNTV
jgi:hypothetical protein